MLRDKQCKGNMKQHFYLYNRLFAIRSTILLNLILLDLALKHLMSIGFLFDEATPLFLRACPSLNFDVRNFVFKFKPRVLQLMGRCWILDLECKEGRVP